MPHPYDLLYVAKDNVPYWQFIGAGKSPHPAGTFPGAVMYICTGLQTVWEHTRALTWKALAESLCGWVISGFPEAANRSYCTMPPGTVSSLALIIL